MRVASAWVRSAPMARDRSTSLQEAEDISEKAKGGERHFFIAGFLAFWLSGLT
jgi:hypothetical protein